MNKLLAGIVLILFILFTVTVWVYSPVIVAEAIAPAATPAPVTPEPCVAFADTGSTLLHRCLDTDYGYICYLNELAAGVIDCVELK